MSNNYTFRKRTFLNPQATNTTSYILAFVESSYGGEQKWGGNLIILADCHRSIELEFALGNAKQRHLSLKKIDKLINTLTEFRAALIIESELIEKG